MTSREKRSMAIRLVTHAHDRSAGGMHAVSNDRGARVARDNVELMPDRLNPFCQPEQ